jgi:hypothetical protein
MAKYKALTVINLPGVGRKMPGESISEKELKDANQTEDDIKTLVSDGALGSPDDDLHNDHKPIEVTNTSSVTTVNVYAGDEGIGGDTT